jgi:membrane-bound lytic murein transglycosylase F
MRVSPTTYFAGPDGPTGFEYELARAFAERLGVRLRVWCPPASRTCCAWWSGAAPTWGPPASRSPSDRQERLRFGPPYKQVTEQVVYRMGAETRPRSLEDLNGSALRWWPGTTHAASLAQFREDYPDLDWVEATNEDTGALFAGYGAASWT